MAFWGLKWSCSMGMNRKIYVILPIVFWIVIIVTSLTWNLKIAEKSMEQTILNISRSFFSEIKNTRLWNAQHGGVYVPITEKTKPNPYLDDPNRDVTTSTGLRLTKINPAYMTRQVAEIAKQDSNIHYHITSSKPIRPANKAEEWELSALKGFASGKSDFFQLDQETKVYRYMAPLLTREACLKCHDRQGYKLGDIRGGFSVSIPAKAYVGAIKNSKKGLILIHLLTLVFGVGFFCALARNRDKQEQVIKQNNLRLEKEIVERKEVEELLKGSEERFRSLSDASFEGIVITEKGKILEANKTMAKMFGYELVELVGLHATDLVVPGYREEVKNKILSGYELLYEIQGLKSDGTPFPAEVHGKMFLYNNRHVRMAAVRDISNRKQIEEERTSSLQRLVAVLDSIDALVYVVDMNSYNVLFINKYGRDIFGEAVGAKCWQIFQKDQTGPCDFCSNKYLLDSEGNPAEAHVWEMQNTLNSHWYGMRDKAIEWVDGRLVRIQIAIDISDKKRAEKEREALIAKLEKALDEIKTLRGILPICSFCKNIRNDEGYYEQIESYIHKHSGVDFSHTICPSCMKKHYPEEYASILKEKGE